jgi:hypothetical protein
LPSWQKSARKAKPVQKLGRFPLSFIINGLLPSKMAAHPCLPGNREYTSGSLGSPWLFDAELIDFG